tara:strand:+ start:2690 stop:2821 length:132 start_codon:yes stop_codon:yes gene_type:complete
LIDMTRCSDLNSWFDDQSKKVDKVEKKTKKEFVTGNKVKEVKE